MSYRCLLVYVITGVLTLSGCYFVNPHENFKKSLYGTIGRDMDNVPPYSWPHKKDLISSVPLPNGNMENRYKYLRNCILIFEIDLKTRIIVDARFEGKETDCVINP